MLAHFPLTIIGTIHQSTQNYRVTGLVKVFGQLRPDVIFEELPPEKHLDPSQMSISVDEQSYNQEAMAIKLYVEKHAVPVIPVDLPDREDTYMTNVTRHGLEQAYLTLQSLKDSLAVSASIRRALNEYFDILEHQRHLAATGTMADINSAKMVKLVVQKHKLVEKVCIPVLSKFTPKAAQCLFAYKRWFEDREDYMAAKIREVLPKFERAVFPVGVEHRIGLYKRLQHSAQLY